MPKTNKTKYAILGILTLGPMSGYDIKKVTDLSISNFWQENYGHIYPVLRRLEAERLVTLTIVEGVGRPDRKVYAITEVGRQEFNQWLDLPPEDEPKRYEFLLKLFFSNRVPRGTVIRKVVEERARREQLLERYIEIERGLPAYGPEYEEYAVALWLSTVRYGINVTRAIIAWCDETIEALRSENN
jgi:PadR family transcriptional regulator AphA